MALAGIDISNCDKEPIHIPGKIQSHGFLVGINAETQLICYISENAVLFLGHQAGTYLGKHVNDLDPGSNISSTLQGFKLSHIPDLGLNNSFDNNPFTVVVNKMAHNLIIISSGDILLLEFEPYNRDKEFDVQKMLGVAISEILAHQHLTPMLTTTAEQIKKIIGYDRVMIYQFAEDGHGEVVAEAKNEELETFLGLHYPASDIPQQARALYKINLTRIIVDVDQPCPVILANTDAPLDLTHSVLRAVSPIHIQYLKNMGVTSSFSISLLSHGELWGLIACHNYSPKFITYKAREAGRLIGQILSPALEYRLGEEDSEKFALINQSVKSLIKYTERETDVVKALTGFGVTINDICSTGAALLFDNVITCLGSTPDEEQVEELGKWILENTKDVIFYTNNLPGMYTPAKDYCQVASGVFAAIISREQSELMLFFKPEQKQSIHWAGNPEKAVTVSGDGSQQLLPRQSFASWLQIVNETSARWTRPEITALTNLRDEVVYQISRKANEIRRLNVQLKQAYEDLETFSYTVSHDLRTPLTSIKGFTEILLHTSKNLDDNAIALLKRINAKADKMTALIKEILHYSSYARNKLDLKKVDMQLLIEDIKAGTETMQPVSLVFIVGDTPRLCCDATMIEQVFTNLVGNAIKYSSKKDQPVVEIKGYVSGDETIYSISDNGIGIDPKDRSEVFDLFKRMENAKDFEGTGVGLAIVKRIVGRHNGRIWFESEPNKGTTFFVAFKNESE